MRCHRSSVSRCSHGYYDVTCKAGTYAHRSAAACNEGHRFTDVPWLACAIKQTASGQDLQEKDGTLQASGMLGYVCVMVLVDAAGLVVIVVILIDLLILLICVSLHVA